VNEEIEDEDGEIGADPRKPFYIVDEPGLNGRIDLNVEGKDTLSLQDAIDLAKERASAGGTQFVIECRVVRKVVYRNPQVQVWKTK
jgi:hypothetical protein